MQPIANIDTSRSSLRRGHKEGSLQQALCLKSPATTDACARHVSQMSSQGQNICAGNERGRDGARGSCWGARGGHGRACGDRFSGCGFKAQRLC
ncbi:hypothetical protein Pyn_13424 [Prunus yedoensis var. nudiflora]|uniref:Uncharacterized protein n=1 Tax=Prunus yedoensis var. nudiflora TaxID=2094558 RepID=A0A315AXI3_PRUYE|nr:hypothetical protein Pyn_13424 [Prunus yedoensis var. nudiflora]